MSFAVVTVLNVGICMGTFNLIINAFFLNRILKWDFDDIIIEFLNSRRAHVSRSLSCPSD
jgi:hypothetical protein